jgi:hypothetical protein
VRGIFISYRRSDSAASAGRIRDRLALVHPGRSIFMDVESIAPGDDFAEEIERAIGQCDVLVAIIGPGWLGATAGDDGRRRIDDAEDFVRFEVATALRLGLRILPVLVDNAPLPAARELPEEVRALTRRNALEIRHARFDADIAALARAVDGHVPGEGAAPPQPPARVRPLAMFGVALAGALGGLLAMLLALVALFETTGRSLSHFVGGEVAWLALPVSAGAGMIAGYFLLRRRAGQAR